MFERIRNLLKHRWFDEASMAHYVDASAQKRLALRVSDSEQLHTGQIRVCVEGGLPTSYILRKTTMKAVTRQRAVMLFSKLRVWDTEQNNGILVYLLLAERAIELVVDRGLNAHASYGAWAAIVQRLESALHQGLFEQGLAQAVDEISALLVAHFPRTLGTSQPNELPDKVVLM
jgi:uncharacterized membrane protein